MSVDWFKTAEELATRLSRRLDCAEDLMQEAVLAVLETESMTDERRLAYIEGRLKKCRKQVAPSVTSLDAPITEDGLRLLDVVEPSPRQKRERRGNVSGPQKLSANKNMRWRHRNFEMRKCAICGTPLNTSKFIRCKVCRAKISRLKRLKKKVSMRRGSKYDNILFGLGLATKYQEDDELFLRQWGRGDQTCPHSKTKFHGRTTAGRKRVRCHKCGKTFTLGALRRLKSIRAKYFATDHPAH